MLPRADYLASKQSFHASSGVLFTSSTGRVLLLETTFRTTWEVPGGAVDPGESPFQAAQREVYEELGLDVAASLSSRLLCLDHRREHPQHPGTGPLLHFLFDGGELAEDTAFVLPPEEVVAAHWVEPADVPLVAGDRLGPRLVAAISAATSGVTLYLEDGAVPVP